MLSRHILPKNGSIFISSHRSLKSFRGRETLEPLERKGEGEGRGIKGFHALKEGEKRREGRVWREGKVEERRASRSEGAMAILLQAVAAPGG